MAHSPQKPQLPPVLLRGLGLRDEGQEVSSRFTSHAPHDTGVPAAAATSGRVISKASGDLGEWETGYTMASPPPHGPLPACTPPAGHPHFPGPTGSPALRNSTGVAHGSPSHGAACSGSTEVLIKPRIPLHAKAPPWCRQAPSSQLSVLLGRGLWLPWGVSPPLHGRHTSREPVQASTSSCLMERARRKDGGHFVPPAHPPPMHGGHREGSHRTRAWQHHVLQALAPTHGCSVRPPKASVLVKMLLVPRMLSVLQALLPSPFQQPLPTLRSLLPGPHQGIHPIPARPQHKQGLLWDRAPCQEAAPGGGKQSLWVPSRASWGPVSHAGPSPWSPRPAGSNYL